MCDTRFVIAYLVKYAAGEDERFVVTLAKKSTVSCTVTEVDEKRRKSGKKASKADGQTISLPEMVHTH